MLLYNFVLFWLDTHAHVNLVFDIFVIKVNRSAAIRD